jgi:hypothetical protein
VVQLPQCAAALAVSTHAPEQFTSVAAHPVVQRPRLQTWFVAHVVPHAPQLFGLLRRSTQTLPHVTSSACVQAPFTGTVDAGASAAAPAAPASPRSMTIPSLEPPHAKKGMASAVTRKHPSASDCL